MAEHLPASRAAGFVADLVALAPIILFSAAIPGQTGTGHINEQWPDYWAELFGRHGYVAIDAIRPRVWRNEAVRWWYAQNLLLFASPAALAASPALAAARAQTRPDQLSLVHPRRFLISERERRRLGAALRQRDNAGSGD
ncbi:MAG: hypothetical protein FJX52_12175 [Alphaproteobacteria bacterium]|nr:hypothetical protein [Alphaproteobacteria bacterium]